MITDPNPASGYSASAWHDAQNNEAADKCEGYTPSMVWQNSDIAGGNPGYANVNLNGRIMALPAIWDPELQRCAVSNLGGNPWVNIGCYTDSWSRTLPDKMFNHYDGTLTPELCQAECAAAGFGYAGVENGGECWCSNTIQNGHGQGGGCSTPCSGDPTTTCGGGWAIQVYQFAGVKHQIKSHVKDNVCIDQGGARTTVGQQMNVWDCTGGSNQKFTLNSADQSIRVVNGGLCFDLAGGRQVNGNPVVQWSCYGGSNQRWIYNAIDRTIRFAANTNLCLEVAGVNTAKDAGLQVWQCWGGPNQAWHIVS